MNETKLWDLNDPDFVSALDEAPLWSTPFGQALLDTVLYRPGASVLDIGSGTGFPVLELAQRFGVGSRVAALDPWRAATDRLRHKMQQFGIENLTVVNAAVESMPFDDASFDLITSNNCLNNVGDRHRAWQECFRVAKPGAQLVATENLPETMMEFYRCFRQTLRELHWQELLPKVDEQIYCKRKPLTETRWVIGQAGFKIEAEKHSRFTMRFVDGSAFLRHSLIRFAFLPSWKALVPEHSLAQVFGTLEDKLNTTAAAQGCLTLTIPLVCFDCRKAA
jgi:arsenite methyltransferase